MTDQDVRDLLARMAAEEPMPFFDTEPLARRARRRAARTVIVGAIGVAAAIAVVSTGASQLRTAPVRFPANPPEQASVDLGIFEPIAGRIVSGTWAVDPIAVDPSAPSRSTSVRLGSEEVLTLGWSRDGTHLLFMRKDQTDRTFPYANHLYILHADGTETQLNEDAMEIDGATIAPDGSRVVFGVVDDGLFAVEAEGGRPVRIAEEGRSPTFSPDGTQIAYVVNAVPGAAHLWVADADGSDAHEILADEPLVDNVDDLVWSPAGDRLAIGIDPAGPVSIYTVAPDGSDLTEVISGGINPFWSPDGSQIAYMLPYGEPLGGRAPGLAIANADGSNVREFGFAASGPWHPGTLQERAEAPSSPSPSASPGLSTSPGFSRFTSTIHGVSIDHPSDWQVRPANEPWNQGAFTFDAPGVDVIFDPTLQDDLYLSLASRPLDGQSAEEWCCSELRAASEVCETGGNFGRITVDGAVATVRGCDGPGNRFEDHVVHVGTATHGYVIYLHVADDPDLQATYTEGWFDSLLGTVELR